jgi:hypothetical protein
MGITSKGASRLAAAAARVGAVVGRIAYFLTGAAQALPTEYRAGGTPLALTLWHRTTLRRRPREPRLR